ncbi:MAG: sortase [Patescibacteria group bacterium]
MSPSRKNPPPPKRSYGVRVGWILIGISILLTLFTYGKILYEELRYQTTKYVPARITKELPPIDTDFGIVIPKIGANAKVIKDVDPYNSRVYQQALTQGVAHAKGSAVPDNEGNVFLFSHSSVNFYEALRYNSIFYLLNKLESDDTIDLYYQNKKYSYRVTKKEIVASTAVEYLLPTNGKDAYTLTLMTCWPPGTSFKRLIITATRTP